MWGEQAATLVGQDAAYARILAPSPITTKLPAGRYVEDPAAPIRRLRRGSARPGHGERPARCRFAAATATAITGGSEGAKPPASLRRGLTECGPKE